MLCFRTVFINHLILRYLGQLKLSEISLKHNDTPQTSRSNAHFRTAKLLNYRFSTGGVSPNLKSVSKCAINKAARIRNLRCNLYRTKNPDTSKKPHRMKMLEMVLGL